MLQRIALLACLVLANDLRADAVPPSFERDIAPIFRERCEKCHNEKKHEGGLRLESLEQLQRGADGEPVVLSGKPMESELYRRVTTTDKSEQMPPSGEPLTSAQVQLIRNWIESGADLVQLKSVAKADDRMSHWAWQPIAKVDVPKLQEKQEVRNPVDLFIRKKLAEKGVSPSREADKRTLIRRVSFDLIGLPPIPEEVAAFESDSSPQAYDHLVERLLASPGYGERWARHWLDVVHYGDTHGYDKDKPRPNAWPYRDYVIRALNNDKPYARFIQEQIAGDVLFPDTADGNEALGFISAGPWDFIGHAEVPESKIDGKIARHLDRDDMVANTMGTFCSITIHCAQCHNHKFDPFTQADYYALQADFAALDRADRKYFPEPGRTSRYYALERRQQELNERRKKINEEIQKQAGPRLAELDRELNAATKGPGNPSAEFGYHSEISAEQMTPKWVQIDLGQSTTLHEVTLIPAYDDFNGIGAGFGFPLNYRVEVCDKPDFSAGVKTVRSPERKESQEPKGQKVTLKAEGIQGQYLRITATKLAPRQNDFIFALAEVEAWDHMKKNVALGKKVTSLDSIEASPRWGKANLVDGRVPAIQKARDSKELESKRADLVQKSTDRDQAQDLFKIDKDLAGIAEELKTFSKPQLVYAGTVHHGNGAFLGTGARHGEPRPVFVLKRGDVQKPGEAAAPGAISAFAMLPGRFELSASHREGDRRVALAHWLTNEKNPLTWRSIVNRVWQYHFGRGLVETANDFGRMGASPSHPELLDWLAADFRDHGGSLKHLHRMIVLSATYRQVSEGKANPRGSEADADNRLLWRQNRRKLEAEAIHDAVLMVSGKLNKSMGGPGYQDFAIEHPEHSPHYEYEKGNYADPKNWRRAVYRFVVRSQTQPFMTSLDCADPSMRVEKRNESVTSLQALAMLNSGFMLTQANYFAERVKRDAGDNPARQVDQALILAFGRAAAPSEKITMTAFVESQGLPNFCRLLMNLNEFVFVD